MMSTKKLIRELRAMVSAMTDQYEIDTTNNNHLRVTIFRSGHKAKIIAPSTPSDRRAMLNFAADLRRTYAAMVA
jgi:alpha-mannosidase